MVHGREKIYTACLTEDIIGLMIAVFTVYVLTNSS
jgi:hypothetical protein